MTFIFELNRDQKSINKIKSKNVGTHIKLLFLFDALFEQSDFRLGLVLQHLNTKCMANRRSIQKYRLSKALIHSFHIQVNATVYYCTYVHTRNIPPYIQHQRTT